METLIRKLITLLEKFLRTKAVDSDNPPPKEYRNKRVLEFAAQWLGTKEWKNGSNPQVEEFHKYASRHNNEKMKDDIAWCSSFVCFVLEKVGMGSTNSRAARSWIKWGVSVKNKSLPGDIVVFWRGSRNGWMGHVGILVKETEFSLYVLGGNQNDSVNISQYSKDRLLDIRRSSKHRALTGLEIKDLRAMGDTLLKTGKVQPPGSMS